MYQTILCNSFSINMLNTDLIRAKGEKTITFRPITVEKAVQWIQTSIRANSFRNAIGHIESDTIIRSELLNAYEGKGVIIPKGKRDTLKLDGSEFVIVAQYEGPRLREGAVALPKDSIINYWLLVF